MPSLRSPSSLEIALIVWCTACTDLGVILFYLLLLDTSIGVLICSWASTFYRSKGKIPSNAKAK